MRRFIMACVILPMAVSAGAHTLPADTGFARQLDHQLLSSHHQPVLLISLAIIILVICAIGRRLRD